MTRTFRGVFFLSVVLSVVFIMRAALAQAEGASERGIWQRIRDRFAASERAGTIPGVPGPEERRDLPREAYETITYSDDSGEVTVTMPDRPDLSKEEMGETINDRLELFPEMLEEIPGLDLLRDQVSGEVRYLYQPAYETVPLELEDLEEDVLYKLYARINQRASIIDAQRIQEMMQHMNHMRTLQRVQQQQQQRQQQRVIQTPPPAAPRPPQRPPARPPSPPQPARR